MEPTLSVITITGTPYNKRFYESAPDMYEALKHTLSVLEDQSGGWIHDLCAEARQALAKAEGLEG